jgi:hypothetical protein
MLLQVPLCSTPCDIIDSSTALGVMA